jgi:MarR family
MSTVEQLDREFQEAMQRRTFTRTPNDVLERTYRDSELTLEARFMAFLWRSSFGQQRFYAADRDRLRPLTQADFSRLLNVDKSLVSRLVKELAERGHLTREGKRLYPVAEGIERPAMAPTPAKVKADAQYSLPFEEFVEKIWNVEHPDLAAELAAAKARAAEFQAQAAASLAEVRRLELLRLRGYKSCDVVNELSSNVVNKTMVEAATNSAPILNERNIDSVDRASEETSSIEGRSPAPYLARNSQDNTGVLPDPVKLAQWAGAPKAEEEHFDQIAAFGASHLPRWWTWSADSATDREMTRRIMGLVGGDLAFYEFAERRAKGRVFENLGMLLKLAGDYGVYLAKEAAARQERRPEAPSAICPHCDGLGIVGMSSGAMTLGEIEGACKAGEAAPCEHCSLGATMRDLFDV